MEDTVFNSKDLDWVRHEFGLTKLLIDKKVLGNSSIRIFCLGPKTEFQSHEHSFTQVMLFTQEREGELILDEERSYPIAAGLVVVVKSNQCHKIINRSDKMMEIIVIENYYDISSSTPFVDF